MPNKNMTAANMRQAPHNYLRAWRRHRGLTQTQLASAIGTSASVVSLMEGGDRQLAPKWLYRLAKVLDAPPGAFLEYGPEDERVALLATWAEIPSPQRHMALQLMKAFRRD
jgi:transcriptional regulator with XRE-family HTH domain